MPVVLLSNLQVTTTFSYKESSPCISDYFPSVKQTNRRVSNLLSELQKANGGGIFQCKSDKPFGIYIRRILIFIALLIQIGITVRSIVILD